MAREAPLRIMGTLLGRHSATRHPSRKSHRVQISPASDFKDPRAFRAPSLLFSLNRSRWLSKKSFTNFRLPNIAPSRK